MVPHIEGRAEVNIQAVQVLVGVGSILKCIDEHAQLPVGVPP